MSTIYMRTRTPSPADPWYCLAVSDQTHRVELKETWRDTFYRFCQAIIISFHVPRFTTSRVSIHLSSLRFSLTLSSGVEKHYGATLPGHSSDRGGCRRRPTAITEINTTGEPAPCVCTRDSLKRDSPLLCTANCERCTKDGKSRMFY